MISFRYHVVTIVAVLIALAVGILLGGTLIDTGLVNNLNQQVKRQGADVTRLQDSVLTLEAQNRSLSTFAKTWFPDVVAGRLTGVPVVILTVDGVDLQTVSLARQALVQAGVTELETVQVLSSMGSTDPSDRSALAAAIGLSGTVPPADLDQRAATALADRLVQAPSTGATDVLLNLQSAGFVKLVGQPSASSIGVPGETVVLIDGGKGPPAVDATLVLVPLIRELVSRPTPVPVVAGEPTDTQYAFVPLIRSSDIDRKLVTVDDVDSVFGQISVAVGLQDLVRTPGAGADYGIDGGASALFPSP